MQKQDIFGLTKHSYFGIGSMFTYQYAYHNCDILTGECTRSELVDDEIVETPISKQEFDEALKKCKEVFHNRLQISVPQTYIKNGKIVFHAIIDNEVVELTSFEKMLETAGIDYVVLDGNIYQVAGEVFNALCQKEASLVQWKEPEQKSLDEVSSISTTNGNITRAERREIAEHAMRKASSFGIQNELLKQEVLLDIRTMFHRNFGLHKQKALSKVLNSKYLYEAHEFIDCYELPLYLWEQVELEKESRV